MNALDLLISSTLAALLLLISMESITRFVRLAYSIQRTFDAKVAQKYQPIVCPYSSAAISVTCTQGERKIVQFKTRYKKFDE
jgi:hypothetical protein